MKTFIQCSKNTYNVILQVYIYLRLAYSTQTLIVFFSCRQTSYVN